ncbi:centrosomal protein CEP76, putative [Hepatocystis sp. ex Piliocolobus tephrosceles]|nr:centrosomal protein CEP76, putative [Hepatocystis sp. ex Piliocolobus tephrosceles]
MFLMHMVKGFFTDPNKTNSNEKKEIDKKVHIKELKNEIWLYKNENSKEELDEEYYSESEEDSIGEENKKKEKKHFLEVPLFEEDENERDIKKNMKRRPNKKKRHIKQPEESFISGSSVSSSDESDQEPFLDLYDELKKEKKIKEFYNPMLKPRLWRFELYIKYIHNLENQLQKNFYVISFKNNNKIELYGNLKKEVLYTPGYKIEPGEIKFLRIPLSIWSRKNVFISYEDLNKFEVEIEMWVIKNLMFNEMYASVTKVLSDVITTDPHTNVILKKKLEKKNNTFETQCLGVYMHLSEVMEFHMALDSWWFITNIEIPSYLKSLPKSLRFKFPISYDDWIIHNSEKSYNNFWLYPGYFCFIGTHQELANSYFICMVLCYNSNYRYKPPILLGSCIISLKSAIDYPFCKGVIKKLTLDKRKFKQGEIIGNIKCFSNSYGLEAGEIENDTLRKPVQPLSDATLVNQLVMDNHYLVIRIKCEDIAINNVDMNNVNINVWVKWDGMVNKTNIVSKTVFPVYYQNLYFPIRLVDKKELTKDVLIKNVLSIDLTSKGGICFEVHNNNEICSTILGIYELPFADIYNYGKYDYRSLNQDNTTGSSIYNEYEYKFDKYDGQTKSAIDNYNDIYNRKYKTVVYKNTLSLMYSTLFLKSFNKENKQKNKKSTISVEAFVIPPLPSSLKFMHEDKLENNTQIYKAMSKRWEKDFKRFNEIYLQWFPNAIKNRSFPCISKNDFDNNFYPLCSYLTLINLPAQISTPGSMLHWLNNIQYIEGDNESAIFTPPYFFLAHKKGTIPDHVLLLCCCLKGMEYDAYICKGTINNGKNDHYWVMTRHEKSWVCFWEVTNKYIIHLKSRWNNNNYATNDDINSQNEMIKKLNKGDDEEYYNGQYLINFIKYGLDEMKNIEENIKKNYEYEEKNKLYTMDFYGEDQIEDEEVNVNEILFNEDDNFDNMFNIKNEKVDIYNTNTKLLTHLLENFSKFIPIAPKMFLIDYENTLTYVPYSSIEVVFNDKQLYGNMQNHHPACILYDFENSYHWRPFLNHPVPLIKNEITISTALSDHLSIKYTNNLEEEIREMIIFTRNKEGLETIFDHSKEIRYFLEIYVDLCEYRLNLDNNCNPKPENYEELGKKGRKAVYYEDDGVVDDEKMDESKLTNTSEPGDEQDKTKKSWSQYKNDSYPSIEAQYINKDSFNFQNLYYTNGDIQTMNNEEKKNKKKKLSSIPKDYIYGMNDEIYDKGEGQYIKNYVFNKNSQDILDNYDEKVKTKNRKRFNTNALHFKEPIGELKEGYIEDITNKNNNICSNNVNKLSDNIKVNICNKKNSNVNNKKLDINNVSEKDAIFCKNIQKEEDDDTKRNYSDGDNIEEELYKEIKESFLCKGNQTNNYKNIPNKYIKKYDKQNNILLKLVKSLRIKEKHIKKDLAEIKLNLKKKKKKTENNDNTHNKLNKKTFFSFIDTHDFLINNLNKHNEKKMYNAENGWDTNQNKKESSSANLSKDKNGLINLSAPLDELNNDKKKNIYNGYFFIPANGRCTDNYLNGDIKEQDKPSMHYDDIMEKNKRLNNIEEGKKENAQTYNNLNSRNIKKKHYTKRCELPMVCSELKKKHKNGQNKKVLHTSKRNGSSSSSSSRNDGNNIDCGKMNFIKVGINKNRPTLKFVLLKYNFKMKKKKKIYIHSLKNVRFYLKSNKLKKKKNDRRDDKKTIIGKCNDEEIVGVNTGKTFFHESYHKMDKNFNVFDKNDNIPWEHQVNKKEKNMGVCLREVSANKNVHKISEINTNNKSVKNISISKKNSVVSEETSIQPPKIWSRLSSKSKYVVNQTAQWNWYYALEEQYFNWQYYKFPVPPNHTFVGFPIHFSTIDVAEVKSFLISSKRFENIMKLSIDKISYFIYCKVYPLIGGVMSNWVFLGCIVPWMTAQERESNMQKTSKKIFIRK